MTSTLLKYNVILIVLCIGIALIHNSSGVKVKKEINLYYDPISPSCRSVLLTLEALKLELNLIHIDLLANKHHTKVFRKINSLHTVPVLQDGDFVLLESNAIMVYLVRQYGAIDCHPLYPTNPKIQAKVNQMLNFDNGTLYPAFKNQYNQWAFLGIPKTKEKEDKIHEALNFLEEVLEKSVWTAGSSMTVADFALVASISTFEVSGVELQNYVRINEWFKNCKISMKEYDRANQLGIDGVIAMLKSMEDKFASSPQRLDV